MDDAIRMTNDEIITERPRFKPAALLLRLFLVSVSCALLFLLGLFIPLMLGFESGKFLDVTYYLWLLALPVCGYAWAFYRASEFSALAATRRLVISVAIAVPSGFIFMCVTIWLVWISG